MPRFVDQDDWEYGWFRWGEKKEDQVSILVFVDCDFATKNLIFSEVFKKICGFGPFFAKNWHFLVIKYLTNHYKLLPSVLIYLNMVLSIFPRYFLLNHFQIIQIKQFLIKSIAYCLFCLLKWQKYVTKMMSKYGTFHENLTLNHHKIS